MKTKELVSLQTRFERADAEVRKVLQELVDDNVRLEKLETERSAAFDKLTKGDGETMTVTADERTVIEGLRSGRIQLIAPQRSPLEDLVRTIFGTECTCPTCTAEREAANAPKN